ncbi:MAG: PQQ-binding-like beta-propeller repeat protein [Polyangiales bacterium]
MNHHSASRRAPFALFLLLASCGSSVNARGFDVDYPSNRASEVSGVAETVAQRPAQAPNATLVVTQLRPARGFVVYDLPSGQQRFRVDQEIDARPIVVADVVISHSGREAIAWDAATGAIRWRRHDHGFSLTGAGGDGTAVALTFGPGGLNRRVGYLAVVDARDGRVLLEREVQQALGTPTVAGGFAFVPWGGQYLSVFDLQRNVEHTRLHSSDDVFARARVERTAVYFGGRNLYRFAPESASGTRDNARTIHVPREDLPGIPPLTLDGYEGALVQRNARERVALIVRPDPDAPNAAPTDNLIYALFHRVVFAVDARDGSVKWGHLHDSDVAGAEAVRGGLVLVDDAGHVSMLDAQLGHQRWRANVATRPLQGILGLPIDFAPGTDGAETPTTPADTLLATAGGTDTRMLPARVFATKALAAMPGADATRALLDIASRESYPPELRAAAGEALATRTEGIDALIDALNTHFDWVRGTPAPPVGFIAQAIARARNTRGVAPLVRHLNDPETPATDLPRIAQALRELNDPSALPAMLDFLRVYHADDGMVPQVDGTDPINDRSVSDQESLTSALEQCAFALVRSSNPAHRRWVESIAVDPNTVDGLRPGLRRALTGGQPGNGANNNSDGGTSTSAATSSEPEVDDPNIPPVRLTMERIATAMEPVREEMRACLRGLSSIPSQVRITFRYDYEGNITSPSVTPPELGACILPIVSRVTLPRSQTPREIGTYYLVGGTR